MTFSFNNPFKKMGFLSVVGAFFLLYFSLYAAIIATGDCDVQLRWATLFGRRKLGRLRDKVVWITGASGGIGEYIARVMARYGAKLVLTARNENELHRVKLACVSEGKLNANDVLVLAMDVTDISKHQSAFNKVIHHFGKLDILVNNAGRSQRAVWEEVDLKVDKAMFDLNVFSAISLSRIAAKHFLSRNEGHLAVTSSLAGLVPVPFSPTYDATKFALHGYFGCFIREKLNKNVGVTILCPGPTFSNILSSSFTSRPGETFGQSHNPTDHRMATERCAYLSALAIVNNVNEAWICQPPLLPLTYLSVYFPTFSLWILKKIGPRLFQHLRDNRATVQDT